MSPVYFWKNLDDGALLLIVLGLFGAIQIYLSFISAFLYLIISPLILAFVPLGVIFVQSTATAVLAELLGSRFFPYRPPRGTPIASPTRLYFRRFAILLLTFLIILGTWAGFFALIFFFSPWTQMAYVVGYIIANVGAALIALTFVVLADWFFTR